MTNICLSPMYFLKPEVHVLLSVSMHRTLRMTLNSSANKRGFQTCWNFPKVGFPQSRVRRKKRKVAHMMLYYVTVFKCQMYITTWWQWTYSISLHSATEVKNKTKKPQRNTGFATSLCYGTVCPHLNEVLCTHRLEKQSIFMLLPFQKKMLFVTSS